MDRREQQHADARAAAGPVDEADRVRLNRPPCTRVCVRLEDAAAPANEEPRAERHDHDPDRRLRPALHRRGQVRAVEDDRDAEGEQRRRVAGAPDQAEPAGAAGAAGILAGDEGRHRGEVVGIACVAQAEHAGDGEDEQERRAV